MNRKEFFTHSDRFAKQINVLSDQCHFSADEAGWWSDPVTGAFIERNKAELIALMHSELSEALEGILKNSMDDKLPNRRTEEVELADAVIRILDYCGAYDLDIGGAIIEKLKYNQNREDHKMENRMKKDGKKF